MEYNAYLDVLSERYKRYFDIHRNYNLLGNELDIFAEYRVKNEKYFLSKSAVIFSFENFEYCLVKCFKEGINKAELQEFTDFLVDSVKEIVKPSSEHMSTYLSGVIVSEKSFSQEVIEMAEKFKYSKNFLFTLKGWCDVRLILVDLERNIVITNKKGREVKKNYVV